MSKVKAARAVQRLDGPLVGKRSVTISRSITDARRRGNHRHHRGSRRQPARAQPDRDKRIRHGYSSHSQDGRKDQDRTIHAHKGSGDRNRVHSSRGTTGRRQQRHHPRTKKDRSSRTARMHRDNTHSSHTNTRAEGRNIPGQPQPPL
jgi:hypothetical protein